MGESSELGVASMFAEVAQDLAAQPTLDDTLHQVVALAVSSVPGCEYAGISWLRKNKRIETPAATDPIVEQCDQAQYEFKQGPCVEAAWEGDSYVVEDMLVETRWPKFVARAAELGARSMLACRLASPQHVIGALNLYARTPGAFDEESRAFAVVYASHASIALSNRGLQLDLQQAFESRGVIGQAIGILVERHRATPDQAFQMLVRTSQTRHVKLRELAAYVVETGIDPGAIDASGGQLR